MSDEKQNQDALQIVNDPKNRISVEAEVQEETTSGMSRRDLLKYSGAAAAALSVAGSAATGFELARTGDAYTGWGNTALGKDMFFNREPFRAETAAMMEPVGEVTRPDWTDHLFERRAAVAGLIKSKQWNPSMGLDAMPGEIGDYYRANPERYKSILEQFELLVNAKKYWNETGWKKYGIANAYDSAFRIGMINRYGSTIPEDPHDVMMNTGEEQPPEKWDYRYVNPKQKLEFISPQHASKLIKQMAHQFGATIVGLGKFDERFMFTGFMRGMKNKGHGTWGDKVPEHWKSIIVLGTPMFWDSTYGAIGYSSSSDAYFRSRVAAGLLEAFIQKLGYGARAQFPANYYEIMLSPYTLTTGLAEYSRAGIIMVPELGGNVRPAGVVTELEFEYDKPININMAAFCKKCKICADTCPSGAITHDDEPKTIVRGFKRWLLDEEKCYSQWSAGPTANGNGCRICIAVCPFSRKNTWIHAISRELDARDATGLVGTGLLAMQQNFFKYPKGEEFRTEWHGGREATYHDPIWWQRSEEFFSNVDMDWEYEGMH